MSLMQTARLSSSNGIAVVEGDAGFGLLASAWAEIFSGNPRLSYAASQEWAEACWKTIQSTHGRELAFLYYSDKGTVSLILPVVIYRKHGIRFAQPLNSDSYEYTEIVSYPNVDIASIIDDIFFVLVERFGVDAMKIPFVKEEDDLNLAISRIYFPSVSWRFETNVVEYDKVKEWDAFYSDRFSLKHRKARKRNAKHLQSQAELKFEKIQSHEVETFVEWIVKKKVEWFRATGIKNEYFDTAPFRSFLVAMLKKSASDGVSAYALRFGSVYIAAEVNIERLSDAIGYIFAYDPEYGKYSPGALIRDNTQRMYGALKGIFDFGVGGEQYKRDWSTRISHCDSYIIALSQRGGLYVLLRKIVRLGEAAKTELKHRVSWR